MGTAGATGAAGSAAIGGDAGATAGEGGMAGGASAEAGSGGPEPLPAAPGEPYAFCTGQSDCSDGLACAASTQNGRTTGYCAPLCGASTPGRPGAGGTTCLQPETGTVLASCVQLTALCLLGSCEFAACPAGMECQTTFVPFGSGLIYGCEYSAIN
jgi:hypothetical protein